LLDRLSRLALELLVFGLLLNGSVSTGSVLGFGLVHLLFLLVLVASLLGLGTVVLLTLLLLRTLLLVVLLVSLLVILVILVVLLVGTFVVLARASRRIGVVLAGACRRVVLGKDRDLGHSSVRLRRVLFGKHVQQVLVVFLLELRLKLLRQVEKVVRLAECTSVKLTVAENVGATQELLVEQNNDFVLSLAHDGASQAEGNVNSLARVHVHHTGTNGEISCRFVLEGLRPEGEPLSEEVEALKVLGVLDLQLDGLVVGSDVLAHLVHALDQLLVESIKSHVNKRNVRHSQSLDPLHQDLQLADGFWQVTRVQVGQLLHGSLVIACLMDAIEG